MKSSKVNLFLVGFMVSPKLAAILKSITNAVPEGKVGKYITASDKAALDAAFADVAELLDGPVMMT
jgi:hypothetical protein